MKKLFFAILLSVAGTMLAQAPVNLTPRPRQMTAGEGHFALQSRLVVAYGSMADSLSVEAARFVSHLNAATGLQATAQGRSEGAITMHLDASCPPEGYRLSIKPTGVDVTASTSAGFF